MTVHLVNLTNPMMMKGPLRETVPVGPFTVHIRVPRDARASRIRLLSAGRTPRATTDAGGRISVTVPSVELHEVVAVDLQA